MGVYRPEAELATVSSTAASMGKPPAFAEGTPAADTDGSGEERTS
jgi:hypothetical protein